MLKMMDNADQACSIPPISRLEPIREPFKALADDIRQRAAGHRFIFLRPDGNFGDALIDHGTREFFADLDLPWTMLDMRVRADKVKALIRGAVAKRTLFIYGGGGSWAQACSVGLTNVARQMRVSPNIMVLPSSIEKALGVMPHTYVRDRFQSLDVLPAAPFCHDMALYLSLVAPDRVLRNRTAPSLATGLVFRTDNEARIVGPASHPANVDISTWGTTQSPIEPFLRHLDQFEHVVTDRLHAAIGATLLGKRVSMVRNSYFKLDAIYKSSIAGNFPNCRLIDDAEALDLVAQASHALPYR